MVNKLLLSLYDLVACVPASILLLMIITVSFKSICLAVMKLVLLGNNWKNICWTREIQFFGYASATWEPGKCC